MPTKIMIVDDDPVLRQILQTYLVRAGYEVVQAEDGLGAWQIFQRDPMRLVITDWMMPAMDGPELIQRIRQASANDPQAPYTYIIMLTAKDGKQEVVQGLESGADDYLTKPFNAGELRARIVIGERILHLENSLKEALKHTQQLATYDHLLVKLLNRRALYAQTEIEINRAQRDHHPLSFIMFDIDFFKSVNERYTHAIGDEALKLIADIIIQTKRPYDLAGRWGGEEFMLVLPNTSLEDAQAAAERLRYNVEQATLPIANQPPLKLTISLGVTSTSLQPDTSHTIKDLEHQADVALMQAKAIGKNRVCVFQP